MAKKNSSKTATEKAISSSEPRLLVYRGWKGVNYADAPLTWEPLETGPDDHRQSDLPGNFLMVQNNLNTTPMLGIETRDDSIPIGWLSASEISAGWKQSGICAMYRHWMFQVISKPGSADKIRYRSLLDNDIRNWTTITVDLAIANVQNPALTMITEIGFYEGNMVAAVKYQNKGYIALAKTEISQDGTSITIKGMDWTTNQETRSNVLVATPFVDDPETEATDLEDNDWPYLSAVGMKSTYKDDDQNVPDAVVRLDVVFDYVNRMGSTLVSYPATIYVEYSPALWSSTRYLRIRSRDHDQVWRNIYTTGITPSVANQHRTDPNLNGTNSISGIDFYARENENVDYVFIGHIDLKPNQTTWEFNWLGNMTDTSQWQNSQLQLPTENTSEGPNVTHFSCHDSRMFYWGQPDKLYRLYIGGNPGAEFSIARGLGGAWVDIEPGSGYEISGTAKWKTSQGANIVTMLCGNRNTNKVKRFNLVETNISLTNEIGYKSYMYEEVSNVVGCNSRYGYGVFDDGLYALSRYGLMLTTMAMEYNNQMKVQDVSAPIKPIFTERLGNRLRDGRMVCIDGIIYIALSEDETVDEPINLDQVILCYDLTMKVWYTYTHDQVFDEHGNVEKIHQLFAVDSDEFEEGLGVVTDTHVILYPTTGIQDPTVPKFTALLETGELMPRMPSQQYEWIEQLEFRFDYFIGDPEDPATILIEGTDYYGRRFKIEKKLNIKSRGNHGLEGEQRMYIEWVRVCKIVESLRIRIKGHARFRLTHIVNKLYTQSHRIGTPYGFDAHDSYRDRQGGTTEIHHYINDYNNLRKAVVS